MSDDTQRVLAALERLETKQDKVRAEIDAIRVGLERMRANITTLMVRLQRTVDQTRDDTLVHFSNSDRAERLSRLALDDTLPAPETLRAMQRQIMRLQTDVEQLRGAP